MRRTLFFKNRDNAGGKQYMGRYRKNTKLGGKDGWVGKKGCHESGTWGFSVRGKSKVSGPSREKPQNFHMGYR